MSRIHSTSERKNPPDFRREGAKCESHLVDLAIGWNMHVIRDAIIFFYIANEFISIVENAGRAGVPIPSVLRKAIELLKDEIK
ncbi:phage holin family protein [Geobacillus stearothermophilus]|nr:phage holin family protein [Geobacillus stearothermophilus]